MIIHHIENQNQNQRSDFCLLNQWDKIWHHSSQIDAWKRDWPRMVLVYTIWVKIIWYRFIWFAVSQFNLDQIQVSSLNFFNFKNFLAPAFLKILLQTGSSFTPVSCLSTFLLVRSYIPLKGKLLALLISGMLDPMVLCGFIPVQLSIFHPNPLIWTPVPIFKLPRGGFPITVSPYVCLVGVDYGWLNIRVLPGRSVTPKGVHDSYQELFRPYIYDQQWELFHPSAVSVSWLFRHHILRGVYPKRVVGGYILSR